MDWLKLSGIIVTGIFISPIAAGLWIVYLILENYKV